MRIAWFVQKLWGVPKFENWSHDPSNAHLGVVLRSIRREWSVIYVCTKFQTDSLIHSEVMRGPKNWKLGHVTPDTPTWGPFYGPYAGRLSPLSLYQIVADYLIRLKDNERVPKFQNWVTMSPLLHTNIDVPAPKFLLVVCICAHDTAI